jgi:hypothetical protein
VIAVKAHNLPALIKSLSKIDSSKRIHISRALFRCGALCKRTSKQYAPISPSQAMLKTKPGFGSKGGGKGRALPGGLRSSIEFQSNSTQAEIYVAANSPAGRYAKRIHDEKGKTWFNRGPGTIAAGPQADEKFIQRAIEDKKDDMALIFSDQLQKCLDEQP